MKKLRGHNTGSLFIPKVVILEAVRMAAGSRQNIVEVCLPNVLAPETLSYEGHLAKYGFPLEPGHSQKFEHYTKPIGYPIPKKTEEEGEKKEQERAFKYPDLGNAGIAHTPVFGKRGQGARDNLKRRRKPRNPELARLLTPENLSRLCATNTQTQIMREINVSRSHLCSKLREFGLEAIPGKAPRTDKDPEIIRLAQTKTVTEIAQRLGISRMAVYQKLYRLGIKAVRGKRGPQPKRGGTR